jgi:hypothetical protein
MSPNPFQNDLAVFASPWLSFSQPHSRETWNRICENIESVYDSLGLPPPEIIPCRGPIPRVFVPGLVGLQLQLGKDIGRKFKFERFTLETCEIRHEWERFAVEAGESLRWLRDCTAGGAGPLLNKTLEIYLEKISRDRVMSYHSEVFKIKTLSKIDTAVAACLREPLGRFERAMSLPPSDELNIWRGFCNRLPYELNLKLQNLDSESDQLLPYDKNGTKSSSWLGAWNLYDIVAAMFVQQRWQIRLPHEMNRQLQIWSDLFRSAAAYLFCENCCFVYLKPTKIAFNDQGKLHNAQGSAIEFVDNTKLFYWNGVEVPEFVVTDPRKIKAKAIDSEKNVEVKRVMIERFGIDRYLIGAKKLHEDEFGILYRQRVPGDEDLYVVKVVNSTPEPDGSQRVYFLRVPPVVKTAREGVAWSFGLLEHEYFPLVES